MAGIHLVLYCLAFFDGLRLFLPISCWDWYRWSIFAVEPWIADRTSSDFYGIRRFGWCSYCKGKLSKDSSRRGNGSKAISLSPNNHSPQILQVASSLSAQGLLAVNATVSARPKFKAALEATGLLEWGKGTKPIPVYTQHYYSHFNPSFTTLIIDGSNFSHSIPLFWTSTASST